MTGTIVLIPKDRREFSAARVQRFILDCLPGKDLEVEIRPRKRERSSQQNRYLHGVAYKLLSDHTGYELEDVAEYLCGSFFGWKDKPMPGKRLAQVPVRTTTKGEDGKRSVLSKLEFAEYVAWIQRFAAKQGVLIPDPDPDYWRNEDEQQAEAA